MIAVSVLALSVPEALYARTNANSENSISSPPDRREISAVEYANIQSSI